MIMMITFVVWNDSNIVFWIRYIQINYKARMIFDWLMISTLKFDIKIRGNRDSMNSFWIFFSSFFDFFFWNMIIVIGCRSLKNSTVPYSLSNLVLVSTLTLNSTSTKAKIVRTIYHIPSSHIMINLSPVWLWNLRRLVSHSK